MDDLFWVRTEVYWMKLLCGLAMPIQEFTSWVQFGCMHMVMWAMAIDAHCLAITTGGFLSLVALTWLETLGLEAIMVALLGLLLVGVNDLDLGICHQELHV